MEAIRTPQRDTADVPQRSHQSVDIAAWTTKHERRLAQIGIESEDGPRLRLAQVEMKQLAKQNYYLRQRIEWLKERPREATRQLRAAERMVSAVKRYFRGLLTRDNPMVRETIRWLLRLRRRLLSLSGDRSKRYGQVQVRTRKLGTRAATGSSRWRTGMSGRRLRVR